MKKIRYCDTLLQRNQPCNLEIYSTIIMKIGRSVFSTDRKMICYNEPMEKHCRNIVDADNLQCNFTGSGKVENWIKVKEEK